MHALILKYIHSLYNRISPLPIHIDITVTSRPTLGKPYSEEDFRQVFHQTHFSCHIFKASSLKVVINGAITMTGQDNVSGHAVRMDS